MTISWKWESESIHSSNLHSKTCAGLLSLSEQEKRGIDLGDGKVKSRAKAKQVFCFLSKFLGTIFHVIIRGSKGIQYLYEALIGEKLKNIKQCPVFKKLFKFCKWFKCKSTTAVKGKHFKWCNSQLIPNNFLNSVERNLYTRTESVAESGQISLMTRRDWLCFIHTKQDEKSIQHFTRKHRSFFHAVAK